MVKPIKHSGIETLTLDGMGGQEQVQLHVNLKDKDNFLNIYLSRTQNITLTFEECVRLKPWLEEKLWRTGALDSKDKEEYEYYDSRQD